MQVYHSACIKEKLGLDREKLVAMALLLGSDYTDGAKNIGPETAMKLLGKDGSLTNTNVLERLVFSCCHRISFNFIFVAFLVAVCAATQNLRWSKTAIYIFASFSE